MLKVQVWTIEGIFDRFMELYGFSDHKASFWPWLYVLLHLLYAIRINSNEKRLLNIVISILHYLNWLQIYTKPPRQKLFNFLLNLSLLKLIFVTDWTNIVGHLDYWFSPWDHLPLNFYFRIDSRSSGKLGPSGMIRRC